MIANSKWNEMDKVKRLIYLSLGIEGINMFHQRNPHTDLAKCSRDALVIQLQDTFKEIRNETFNRFQFFRCTQNPGESLEQFHSRIRQKAALCNWEDLEDILVSNFKETLHYAITRERGQENQQRISSTYAQNPNGSGINLIQRTTNSKKKHTTHTSKQQQNTRLLEMRVKIVELLDVAYPSLFACCSVVGFFRSCGFGCFFVYFVFPIFLVVCRICILLHSALFSCNVSVFRGAVV